MHRSILEILESAGLDILNNIDDAEWFVDRVDEISDLVEMCSDLVEMHSSLVEKAHED